MIDRERFVALLRTAGMTQADLARHLKVTPSAVHQLLSGKTKNSRLTPKIAQILEVPEAYLTGESDHPYLPVSGTMTPEELASALKDQLTINSKMVGSKLVKTDDNGLSIDEGSNEVFEPDWLLRKIASFDAQAVVRYQSDGRSFPPIVAKQIVNDAMAPTLMRGDEVVFSTETRTIDVADGIWLFTYGGLLMTRRLTPLPDGRGYRVSGDNPGTPTFEAPTSDINVLGRAFWVGRALA